MATGRAYAGTFQDDPHGELDRKAQIMRSAVECFGNLGYYGTSLQRIANQVGLTKPGLLHYIGSKEGLLNMVLTEMYDMETDRIVSDQSKAGPLRIPSVMRAIVAVNAQRPQLVHMFSTLSAEALSPEHPAHEYFRNREREGVGAMMNIAWLVPDGIDLKTTIITAWSAMDGIQLRWLRSPGQDLNAMWADCENTLFPLPVWEHYR